jgi:hypothetical protein
MVKAPHLDSSLTAAQSLVLRDLEGYRRSQHLNNSDRKQAMQTITKQYTKQYLNTKKTIPKDSTHRYKCVSVRIA